MGFGARLAAAALAMASAALVVSPAWAGDDGAAPIWQGIWSIFSPAFGLGGAHRPPIDYRQYGKLVLPQTMALPPPGSATPADSAWPVSQEIVRRKALKQEGKKTIAGVGDARLRYTPPFPANTPVTVRPVTPDGQPAHCQGPCGSTSPMLSKLNPLHWVGLGKSDAPLGPEPDREWLTDPPKGFRAPVGPSQGSAAN